MYRCEICNRVAPPGTTAIKRVIETREREYPDRRQAAGPTRKSSRQRNRRTGDRGGCGREIVREQQICPSCAEACAAEPGGDLHLETGTAHLQ